MIGEIRKDIPNQCYNKLIIVSCNVTQYNTKCANTDYIAFEFLNVYRCFRIIEFNIVVTKTISELPAMSSPHVNSA